MALKQRDTVPAFEDEPEMDVADGEDESLDEGLPTTENDLVELHLGFEFVNRGHRIRVYIKRGATALPGETDVEHQARVQELLVSAYLNHTEVSKIITEATIEALNK